MICQGCDTGYGNESDYDVVLVDMADCKFRGLVNACKALNLSIVETVKSLSILCIESKEKKSLKDLGLELILRNLKLEEIDLIRKEWEDYPKPCIRPSQSLNHIRPFLSQHRIRLKAMDSRSGMKGRTIRKRLGKYK